MPDGPVLALDLGGTNARAAVVTPDGWVVARRASATPMPDGLPAVLELCLSLLRDARDLHLAEGGRGPVAVGIAAPGPLDPRRGVLIDPPNMRGDWWGFPLGPTIGEALGLPWALGKDTNVNILAERDFGAGEGSGDLVYLTISTGIGGAVLSGGQPITGPDGLAGELGHMTIDMDGPVCGCGGIGHLEAVASGTGIANAAQAALEAGADGRELARIAAAIAPRPLSAVHVSAAAAAGDAAATVILERARRARGSRGGLHRERLRPGQGHPGWRHHAGVGRGPAGTRPGSRGPQLVPAAGTGGAHRACCARR
jgi:glucokinase